jgi:hypothetical protein
MRQDAVLRDLQNQIAVISSKTVDGRGSQPLTASARRIQLENAFASDPVGHLADEMRQAMNERLAVALPEGSTVRRFECKSSICRIETGHANRTRYDEFVRAAFLKPGQAALNRPNFTVPLSDDPSADGTLIAVTFLAREGHSLPSES